jgi:di/tricarboxylate transporter
MSDTAMSLAILVGVIGLYIWNRLPVEVVAVCASLALYLSGVLTSTEALAGFGDPVVIFIAALFIVSEGIDSTGVTTWAGQALIDRAGTGRVRLLASVMALCAVLTALISINGAVAALLPMVVVLAMRVARPSSQMLIPLAFAGSAGSLLALTGSPVNVIVAEASRAAGGPGFGFFEFAAVGIPLVIGTVVIAVVLGPRLLPTRSSTSAPPDLSQHAHTLSDQYQLDDGFYRLRVRKRSPLIGISPDDLDLSAYPWVNVIGLQARTAEPALVRHQIEADDVLVVTGDAGEVSRLIVDLRLAVGMRREATDTGGELVTRELGVVEVVVPPRSPLVGEAVFPGMMRTADLVVLAVHRLGKDRGPRVTELAAGDSILLHGSWAAIDALADRHDILVVDAPDLIRRQAVPMGPKAKQAVLVLVGMVLLLAFGVVPPAMAGVIAATAMILLRVLNPAQAYRSVSWGTLILIGGLIPLSTAIQKSAAADLVASGLIGFVGTGRPYLLMVALFVLTAALGQVVSNAATVLIVAPIAVAAAVETGVSVQPILMLIAVAGAAAFLTPIATPANMMVMGPGGYRFNDYWRLGLVQMLLFLAVAIGLIPLVWPL